MDSTLPVEQRLIEAVRVLTPDKQQAVLDFAEFLQNRQIPAGACDAESSSNSLFREKEDSNSGGVNLEDRGIDLGKAAELRYRLQPFSEDWDRPEMAIYDEI